MNKIINYIKINQRPLIKITICWIAVRILLIFLTDSFGLFNDANLVNFLDAEHYIEIAYHGYHYDYLYAFFPLLPLVIKLIGIKGTIILNNVISLITVYLVYYLVDVRYKNANKYMAALLYAVSPIHIYSTVPYTEMLCILLILLTVIFYEHKCFIPSGICLGLSISCRSTASALYFALFIVEIINLIKSKQKADVIRILKVFSVATIIASIYPVFCYIKTNNMFAFVSAQQFWDKISTNIITFIPKAITIYRNYQMPNDGQKLLLYILPDLILTIVFIIFTIINTVNKNNNLVDKLYMIISILLITMSIKNNCTPLISYIRYLLICFPFYIYLSRTKLCHLFVGLTVLVTPIMAILFFMQLLFY